MRIILLTTAVAGLLFGLASNGRAQDNLRAIIEKAVKAHGGADRLAKLNALQVKAKGTLEIMGLTLPFTKETAAQLSGQFKEVMEMDVNGVKVTATTVFDKDKGWINANGMNIDMDDKMVKELKEAVYQMTLGKFLFVDDKNYTLALLPEIKINDGPAVGIRVSTKGHRDVSLYFDKGTGLMVKKEARAVDFQTQQEVTEETIIRDYQDKDGLKTAKKVEVLHDGKKIMEAEVLDVKFVDKLDDSEFRKP
jgi:hypothetical protein